MHEGYLSGDFLLEVEVSGLIVPSSNGSGDSVHALDVVHNPGQDSCFKVRDQGGSVMVWGLDIIFSIIHLSLLIPGSPFTFTVSIMFFANTFHYMIQ